MAQFREHAGLGIYRFICDFHTLAAHWDSTGNCWLLFRQTTVVRDADKSAGSTLLGHERHLIRAVGNYRQRPRLDVRIHFSCICWLRRRCGTSVQAFRQRDRAMTFSLNCCEIPMSHVIRLGGPVPVRYGMAGASYERRSIGAIIRHSLRSPSWVMTPK
jgi:hypothetical protein